MKRDNINYLMVGSFVLLTVIGLMVFLYMVTGSSGPADRYRIQYRHVTGIKFGTAVYYEGYRVGQVEKITPEWEVGSLRYRVDISVIRDWEIPDDSVARMMASGLLSAISINIHQGPSRELLKPGGVIRGEEGGDIFSLMHTVALEFNQLAKNSLGPLLVNLNRQVEEFSTRFGDGGQKIIEDAAVLLAKLNDNADRLQELLSVENRHKISAVVDNMKVTSDRAVRISENVVTISDEAVGITGRVKRVVGNVESLSEDILRTREQVDTLLGDLRGVVADNRPNLEKSLKDVRRVLDIASQHVDRIVYHMEGTSRNMHEFSRQIRQNPGLLLGGVPPDDGRKVDK